MSMAPPARVNASQSPAPAPGREYEERSGAEEYRRPRFDAHKPLYSQRHIIRHTAEKASDKTHGGSGGIYPAVDRKPHAKNRQQHSGYDKEQPGGNKPCLPS